MKKRNIEKNLLTENWTSNFKLILFLLLIAAGLFFSMGWLVYDKTQSKKHQEKLTKQHKLQKLWEKTILPATQQQIAERTDYLLKELYKQFLDWELTTKEEEKRINGIDDGIKLEKINGRPVTKETKWADTAYLRINHPWVACRPQFLGFAGFIDSNDEEKETVVMGLTHSNDSWKIDTDGPYLGLNDKGEHLHDKIKASFYYKTLDTRKISIVLKKELFFNRENHNYNSWINDSKSFNISWEMVKETIAHELAHALANTFYAANQTAGLDKEGHGEYHDKLTERMKEMMERSPTWKKFEKWWKIRQKD